MRVISPVFCRKPHRAVDGKPVGHSCFVMHAALLEEEAKGVHRGVDPRIQPLQQHRGLSSEGGEEAPLTHYEMCKIGGLWLQRAKKCPLVVVDHQSLRTQEQPDALGWRYGGRTSYLLEIKTSRADFQKDRKKPFRALGAGMGMFRYFLVPQDLVKVEEVPEGWGLLYLKGTRRIEVRKEATFRQLEPSGRTEEKALLVGILERTIQGWPTPSLLPHPRKQEAPGAKESPGEPTPPAGKGLHLPPVGDLRLDLALLLAEDVQEEAVGRLVHLEEGGEGDLVQGRVRQLLDQGPDQGLQGWHRPAVEHPPRRLPGVALPEALGGQAEPGTVAPHPVEHSRLRSGERSLCLEAAHLPVVGVRHGGFS